MSLSLFDLYGCYSISIARNGEEMFNNIGEDLLTRLLHTEEYLKREFEEES